MRGSGSAWLDTGAGMFFSSNNGLSWDNVNTGLPFGIYYQTYDAAHRVIAHPLQSGTYFLLMGNVGVFQTDNAGTSWQKISSEQGTVMEYSPRKGGTLFLGASGSSGIMYYNAPRNMTPILMLLLN